MTEIPELVVDWQKVREVIKGLTEEEQRIVLLRLAAKFNNGSEHFYHGPYGYSWLCHACAVGLPGALGR